ncbi:hypothetical protein B0H16DRAFT_1469785 [Mycena metata]|uniref:Uncharacterized protein n=1 Tax=Mycena metata TaxID=1033252 RepID=A0AAD7HXY8_9AGAR|nr:hypothetical protein B0H16DRAFT_1469785 [Mycena metata]
MFKSTVRVKCLRKVTPVIKADDCASDPPVSVRVTAKSSQSVKCRVSQRIKEITKPKRGSLSSCAFIISVDRKPEPTFYTPPPASNMENTDLNVNNTAAKLVKATQLVRACGKKNATNKKRAGGNPYKQGLEERMAKCQALITQCLLPEPFFTSSFHIPIAATMDTNAPTLQGSPNDDPMTGGSPHLFPSPQYIPLNDNIYFLFQKPRSGCPRASLMPERRLPNRCWDFRLQTVRSRQSEHGAGCSTRPLDLDCSEVWNEKLNNPPQIPRSTLPSITRNHRLPKKAVLTTASPCTGKSSSVVADSIPGRIISAFTTAWHEDEIQVQKADPSLGAESFGNLYQAAIEIMDRVEYTAEKAGPSYEDLKWNITYTDGGAVQVSDLIALRQWLIASGAMVDDIQPASVPALAVKKVSSEPTIKIWVDMDNDFGDDDRSPEGPQSVSWSGCERCVSCDSVRGKALESRPAPHPDDGEFLAQCKCPLQGAALELWMIKMTAEMEGAIQAVYGHQVETLLQPEVDRLEFAVHWALEELTLYAARDDSQYAASFPLLLTQFKQTMVAWEKEQEEDRARKN